MNKELKKMFDGMSYTELAEVHKYLRERAASVEDQVRDTINEGDVYIQRGATSGYVSYILVLYMIDEYDTCDYRIKVAQYVSCDGGKTVRYLHTREYTDDDFAQIVCKNYGGGNTVIRSGFNSSVYEKELAHMYEKVLEATIANSDKEEESYV